MRTTFLILFCFLCFSAFTQETEKGTIFGTVIDQDGKSLVGASIIYRGEQTIGATTDIEGNYKLQIPAGTRTLVCRFSNMVTDTFTVEVKANQFIEHNVQLEKHLNSITKFDEVQIRVGKFDRKPEDITVSISIIDAKLIENKNTRNVKNILDQTPGLNIMDGEPKIRGGSGFTFGVGSSVGIYMDGMPMLTGDAGRPMWAFIPVENIQQIEVIKGAGSVLSGSASLSGAIRIHTKYPSVDPLTRVNVYSGFYSYPKKEDQIWQTRPSLIEGANFLHSRKIGNWDLTVGGDINYDDGYMGPPLLDPYIAQTYPDTVSNFVNKQMRKKRARLNFKVRHRSKKHHGLSYGLTGNGMIRESPMVFAWLNDSSGLYRGYPGATFLSKQTIFYLNPFISWHLPSGSSHKLLGRFLYNDNNITSNQSTNTKEYFISYQFKQTYERLLNIDFIAGLTSNYVDSYSEMYIGSGTPYNNMLHVSGYGQIQKNFWDILNLSVGGRLEYYSVNDSIKELQPVFRASGNLKLMEATYLRFSYGQGFRFPNITERFIQTGVGNFGVFPNPEIQPEYSTNSEIGIRQGIKIGGLMGFIDVAGYWQEYKNTIQYLFGFWDLSTPLSAGFKFLNTGRSRVLGIDASFVGKADLNKNNSLNIILGYNYILPKTLEPEKVYAEDNHPMQGVKYSYNNTSLNPGRHILKYRFLHNVKADVSWHFKDKIGVGVTFKYFSKMANMDGIVAKFENTTKKIATIQDILYMDYYKAHNNGVYVFDLRGSYAFNEMHKIAVICKNLLNNQYSLRPLKIEAPRSIVLQYTFSVGG